MIQSAAATFAHPIRRAALEMNAARAPLLTTQTKKSAGMADFFV
ncbi:hypothetical protein EKH55_2752 [Sinorhizobium alkalisoli]|nr:hypothetical protein EKH55_2752 [Sinorhizobium alkalisoli]